MTTWFISDTHFEHKNIIEYCSRPFKDVTEMNEKLISNWNSVVTEFDIVFHGGDFGLLQPTFLKPIFKRLNGYKKFLIKGNHDKSTTQLYLMGWDGVFNEVIIKVNGCKILLRHKPLETKKPEHIDFIVHGHTHNTKGIIYPNHVNISVENINYTPISDSHLVKSWKKSKKDIPLILPKIPIFDYLKNIDIRDNL
jgi:calcineurin-like phosphoesterase family protein